MDLTTGLTTTHHSAVNLPSDTSAVRVQAVNTAGTSTSNTVVLQGLYVKHDCMYTLLDLPRYLFLYHIITNSCILLQCWCINRKCLLTYVICAPLP